MQEFTNGRIYEITRAFLANDAYTVPGGVNEIHLQQGGTATKGFPIDEPKWSAMGSGIFLQDFESGWRYRSVATGEDVTEIIEVNRDYATEKYDDLFEGIQDAFAEEFNVYGVAINAGSGYAIGKALTFFLHKLAKQEGKKAVAKVAVRWIPAVGWGIAGATVGIQNYQDSELKAACGADPYGTNETLIEGKRPAYYCGKLAVRGTAFAAGLTSGVLKPWTWFSKTKLNVLGVNSLKAQLGKSKMFGRVDTFTNWTRLKTATILHPKTRTKFYERIEKLGLNNDQIDTIVKNKKAVDLLFSEKYYKWVEYAERLDRDILTIPSSVRSRFAKEGIPHIIKGEFHPATGLFTGNGFHNPHALKEAMDNGVVEVFQAGKKIKRFEDIKAVNGVREVSIAQRVGDPVPKSFFPDTWTEQDMLDAIIEASGSRTHGTSKFSKQILKKGVTIQISGYFEDVSSNLITSGFPGFHN